MPDAGQFSNQCRGKERFRSRKSARGVLRVMKARQRSGETLNEYKCPECRYWHLGNTYGRGGGGQAE